MIPICPRQHDILNNHDPQKVDVNIGKTKWKILKKTLDFYHVIRTKVEWRRGETYPGVRYVPKWSANNFFLSTSGYLQIFTIYYTSRGLFLLRHRNLAEDTSMKDEETITRQAIYYVKFNK